MNKIDDIKYYGELPVAGKPVYDFKNRTYYYNLPCAFDIETTNINNDPKSYGLSLSYAAYDWGCFHHLSYNRTAW